VPLPRRKRVHGSPQVYCGAARLIGASGTAA